MKFEPNQPIQSIFNFSMSHLLIDKSKPYICSPIFSKNHLIMFLRFKRILKLQLNFCKTTICIIVWPLQNISFNQCHPNRAKFHINCLKISKNATLIIETNSLNPKPPSFLIRMAYKIPTHFCTFSKSITTLAKETSPCSNKFIHHWLRQNEVLTPKVLYICWKL